MTVNQIIELKIETPAYRGRSIGRLDGFVYFVSGVLPGETVRARITKQMKNHGEAVAEEVLTPSPARILPACGLAAKCPGCCYQHASYEAEVSMKQETLLNLLERLGGCPKVKCTVTLPSPSDMGYRNKLTMHADSREGQKTVLGYFAEDNESILDVPQCPLATAPVNSLLKEIRNDGGFIASLRNDSSVILRWTPNDGAMYWTDRTQPPKPMLTETTIFGKIAVPAGSFFQVNLPAADLLINHVSRVLKEISPKTVLDLYCGIGMFAFAAAQAGAETILGIDSDEDAVTAAKENARLLNFDHIKFTTGLVSGMLDNMLETVETTVILDPPRRGLEKNVTDIICRHKPAEIIYISCAADTMARDVKQLSAGGYQVLDTAMVDMFPRTPHFESITRLHLTR